MAGRRGAREEHTEVHWMQVYLITGAKAHSQGSKADWDYWCTAQDSDGTQDPKVRLSRKGVDALLLEAQAAVSAFGQISLWFPNVPLGAPLR